MPRAALTSVVISSDSGAHKPVNGSTFPLKDKSGHTLTVYADGAVYDETAGKTVGIDSLTRA